MRLFVVQLTLLFESEGERSNYEVYLMVGQ
jgi:hypothetical protein